MHGAVTGPGTYRLRLRWSPHRVVTSGSVTISEHEQTGTITLDAAEAGPFSLAVRVDLSPFS